MPRYDVPKVMSFGDAIQANQSMMDGFRQLGSISQNYLNQEEQKKQNEWSNAFEGQRIEIDANKNNIAQQEIEFKKNQDVAKKQANTEALKFVNPELFQSIQSQYGETPSVENANKMNDITGNINLDKVKPIKPNYKLEKTDKGFVMFNTSDPSAEPYPIANYKPYSKPSNSAGIEKKTTDQLNWLLYNTGRKTKGLDPISYDEFYDQKMNTKSMGVGLRDANSVEQETGRVAKTLNLNPYQMSSYDFSKLQPEQRYEMDNLITTREQGLKSKVPDWMKKNLDDLSAVVYSAGEVSKNINSNDTGLIDSTYNKINQYLGMGDSAELAKRSLTQANYQLYSNFMLKSMSGLAVTQPEEERFTKAFGSLMLNDSVAAVKIKTNMENLSYRLENMKKSYDPIAFNYRYGHLQKGVENAISKMDKILQNGSTNNTNFVNSDGTKYEDKTQNKTIVQTLKNKTTGQIMNKYSDGSVSYE
ncbi:hypothetical protein [Arcobacter defluvii]|uniref:Uncharacterized protein n=1 Tax=Arcobacter defluvii TaxID=873191 RepID=A0AAE7BD07_9BACT|nr:hypothetical protein [Arcobacter defluvii]QKF77160.1 hypothetical protein ADFLV_1126 [Arcobacter defluvii]RXI33549.1 hypothetical protein CP964_06030 [Arcobacter defluvii]